ncbi:hypothetical protein [Curvivirga sp.]|uniref:hypothetical protein n=1 Tax=Curvivirga sp. TaxID=2856848 RepID=UPI003B59C74A
MRNSFFLTIILLFLTACVTNTSLQNDDFTYQGNVNEITEPLELFFTAHPLTDIEYNITGHMGKQFFSFEANGTVIRRKVVDAFVDNIKLNQMKSFPKKMLPSSMTQSVNNLWYDKSGNLTNPHIRGNHILIGLSFLPDLPKSVKTGTEIHTFPVPEDAEFQIDQIAIVEGKSKFLNRDVIILSIHGDGKINFDAAAPSVRKQGYAIVDIKTSQVLFQKSIIESINSNPSLTIEFKSEHDQF